MEKFMKMLEKKKGSSKLGDLEKEAKMKALGDLKSMAEDDMGEKVKGLKKVSVASDSKKGLEMGLKQAEEMVGDDQEQQMLDSEESPEHEASETPEEETAEHSGEYTDVEDLDKKIQELMALKDKLFKK